MKQQTQNVLNCLLAIYNECKKAYTSINVRGLTDKHSVPQNLVLRARHLGLIQFIGEKNGRKYYWKGNAPTEQDAINVVNTIHNPAIIYKEDRKLIPIAGSKRPIPTQKKDTGRTPSKEVEARYFPFLKAFHEDIYKNQLTGNQLYFDHYKVQYHTAAVMESLNWITKTPNGYNWNTTPPTQQMGSILHSAVLAAAKANYQQNNKPKKKKQKKQLIIAKTIITKPIEVNTTLEDQTLINVNNLIAQGKLELAEKLLDRIEKKA